MVYKRIDFRQEWYTKEWISDGSGVQKDRFYTTVVYKRMDLRREGYTKGSNLDGICIQKNKF